MSPSLRINPVDDTAFVDAVESQADGAKSPTALEAGLRTEFPNAVVRARQLEGEQARVWYVYRDGHWVTPG